MLLSITALDPDEEIGKRGQQLKNYCVINMITLEKVVRSKLILVKRLIVNRHTKQITL